MKFLFLMWAIGSTFSFAADPRVLGELSFNREAGQVRYQALSDGTVLKRIGDKVVRQAKLPGAVFDHAVKGLLFEGLESLRKGKGVDAPQCLDTEARVVVPGGAPFRVCEEEAAVREVLRQRAEAFEMVMKRDYGKH